MSSESHLIYSWQFILAFAAFIALTVFGAWRRRKETDQVNRAITGFKYLTLGYCIFIFAMLISLPPIGIWRYHNPEEFKSLEIAREKYKELGLDLNRIKDVAYWVLFLLMIWLINLFSLLNVVVVERNKKTA